jgi:hypothetical protein
VIGIDLAETTTAYNGVLFTVQSPDVVLRDGEIFFSFRLEAPRQDLSAKVSCAVAFEQAMSPHGTTLDMAAVLSGIVGRVNRIVNTFREQGFERS